MPELPEVETVRRALATVLPGRQVRRVSLRFPDIVHAGLRSPRALLQGAQLAELRRHGKQLALLATDGRVLHVHLGMTGAWSHLPADDNEKLWPHSHVLWHLDDGSRLVFSDPRRFGGVWTFPDLAALEAARWCKLGPDALVITPVQLHAGLQRTQRDLKAALLDQTLVAGLGNIYTDELLFGCRLHPRTPACSVDLPTVRLMVTRMRRLLKRAIAKGGSSVRDYVDSMGREGWFQIEHHVYGRAGQPCSSCGNSLSSTQVGGRTTVWCDQCQVLKVKRRRRRVAGGGRRPVATG